MDVEKTTRGVSKVQYLRRKFKRPAQHHRKLKNFREIFRLQSPYDIYISSQLQCMYDGTGWIDIQQESKTRRECSPCM